MTLLDAHYADQLQTLREFGRVKVITKRADGLLCLITPFRPAKGFPDRASQILIEPPKPDLSKVDISGVLEKIMKPKGGH
jgi:hypothetical protein